jgi:hypothetical protein
MVSVSVDRFVTRTISQVDGVHAAPDAPIVALNGVAGNRDPVPPVTTRDVPDVAGLGAVATVVVAKFLCAS